MRLERSDPTVGQSCTLILQLGGKFEKMKALGRAAWRLHTAAARESETTCRGAACVGSLGVFFGEESGVSCSKAAEVSCEKITWRCWLQSPRENVLWCEMLPVMVALD